uniref:Uncharacterized protein n=1 Tax=Oryza barthii TaxID=65489 RepID=A0A0D3GEI3_9ORYZ
MAALASLQRSASPIMPRVISIQDLLGCDGVKSPTMRIGHLLSVVTEPKVKGGFIDQQAF